MTLLVAAEPFLTVDDVRDSEVCADCLPADDADGDELIAQWIDEASDLIASLSGMRIAGQFSVVARPCRNGLLCDCICTCCRLDSVPLGDPKPTVTEVWIDGAQLDEAEYDLHWGLNGWSLVKVGDGVTKPRPWPSNQQLWKNHDQTGTFAIFMTLGRPVNHTLIRAAVLEMVCKWADGGAAANGNTLQPGVVAAQLGGTTVQVDQDEEGRAEAAMMGPALTELLASLAPQGTEIVAVYAPELAEGWSLNLRPDVIVGS